MVLFSLVAADVARAQSAAGGRWVVDPKASLAWWQINPHYNHLWATTCPSDPSWQAGEGRSPEYYVNYEDRPKALYDANTLDTRIPLFPRKVVRPLCQQAVRGELTVAGGSSWRDVRGTIVIQAESLVTGQRARDKYARRMVLKTSDYPEIRFTLDSVGGVQQQPGDTVRATAFGTLDARGQKVRVTTPVRGWPEAGGMRVLGQFEMPASALSDVFGISRLVLGMGVAQHMWKTFHMGVDLLLRPQSQ